MIDTASLRRRPVPIDRSSDRRVVVAAIVIAFGYLVASAMAVFLDPAIRRGIWLPLHLALAGGASTAIAGVMPFFSAAFAAAPPTDARLRSTAVSLVAGGALAMVVGVTGGVASVAVAGGLAFIAGIVLTATATVRPLRAALGPSRGLITEGYAVGLSLIALGAVLGTLYLAGWAPIMGAWAQFRPAHAWLDLVGFASLVIATTLLHFFPTVIGARIANDRAARVTVVGLGGGGAVVALGFVVASDLVVRVGALSALAGAVALAVYAARVWPRRGRWTTDRGWHRFAMGGLISAIAWFEVGMAIAVARALAFGADPSGWSLAAVAAPLIVGWAGISILASATHLVPAIGPGDALAHARQRVVLGRAAAIRLVALDLGVAGLALGLPLDIPALAIGGSAAIVAVVGGTTALLIRALVETPASRA